MNEKIERASRDVIDDGTWGVNASVRSKVVES